MQKKIYNEDNPHQDIGKQKFRVRRHYSVWVEYDVVAENKDGAESAVSEHGGIHKIEWQEGYHNDEPVEVYANDWNTDHQAEMDDEKYARTPRIQKVEECIPYEDSDSIDYQDPHWTKDDYEWKKTGKEPSKFIPKIDEEIPF